MCGMCSPVQWNHETPNQSLNCGTLGKRGRLWVIIVSCLLPLLKTLQKRGTAKVLTNFQLPVWQKVCFVVFAASCRSRGKSYSQEFHFSHAFSFFWQNKKEEKSTQLRPTPILRVPSTPPKFPTNLGHRPETSLGSWNSRKKLWKIRMRFSEVHGAFCSSFEHGWMDPVRWN